MVEKNELAGLPEEKVPPPESAAPAEGPTAATRPMPPKGSLEDFKIPRKEIEGSTRMRLEISSMSERVRAELESD